MSCLADPAQLDLRFRDQPGTRLNFRADVSSRNREG